MAVAENTGSLVTAPDLTVTSRVSSSRVSAAAAFAGGAGVAGELVWARKACETRQIPNSNGQAPTQREKRFFIPGSAGARFRTLPTRLQRASRNVRNCSLLSVASAFVPSASQTIFGIFSANNT